MGRQISPLLRQISLRALRFYMCKFHGKHDHATRYTKRCQTLLSKCNAYSSELRPGSLSIYSGGERIERYFLDVNLGQTATMNCVK